MRDAWKAVLWGLGLAGTGIGAYFALRTTGVAGELPRASGDDFLMNLLTLTSTKEGFVKEVTQAVRDADPTLPPSAQRLIAAWAALESGWGKTRQAKLGFNLWNLSKGGWTGPTIPGGDTEFTPGSAEAKAITQQWRQYGSGAEAVKDILGLLKYSRFVNYREAYADLQAGNETFATRLGVFERGPNKVIVRVDNRPNTAGYYTLPRSEYQQHVSSLYRTVSLLDQQGFAGLAAEVPPKTLKG